MRTQIDELAATLADMQALLADAPAHMVPILEQQISWARDTLSLFGSDVPGVPEALQWAEHEQGIADERTSVERLDRPPDPVRHRFVDRRAASGSSRKKWM